MAIIKNNTGYSISANILGNKISYQAVSIQDALNHLMSVTALIRSRLAWQS